jgi:hypothetical protein
MHCGNFQGTTVFADKQAYKKDARVIVIKNNTMCKSAFK